MSETNPNRDDGLQTALAGWQPDLIGTLVFVVQGPQVLLIEKKTGHGKGLINGPGGKLDPGEQPAQGAERELHEELSVRCDRLRLMARLRFVDLAGSQWLGFAFLGQGLQGVPEESVEARPLWYPVSQLPLHRMWPDDAIWLPTILAGQPLSGDFLLQGQSLLAHAVRPGAPSAALDGAP
jgi:8-oxo-dGTP diphosphatase